MRHPENKPPQCPQGLVCGPRGGPRGAAQGCLASYDLCPEQDAQLSRGSFLASLPAQSQICWLAYLALSLIRESGYP